MTSRSSLSDAAHRASATRATGQLNRHPREANGGAREGGWARTFARRGDVLAEEVGEDLAELDIEGRGAGGGGGGRGGDEFAELVDVGGVAGHGR
jgi:hypothetical protein